MQNPLNLEADVLQHLWSPTAKNRKLRLRFTWAHFFWYLLDQYSKRPGFWGNLKMWFQQTAYHWSASQWCHMRSQESISFTKLKTAIFVTWKQGKRQRNNTMVPEPDKKPQAEQQASHRYVAYKWCHGMFHRVAITTSPILAGTL